MIRQITELTRNDINIKNLIDSYGKTNVRTHNLQLKNMAGLTNTIYAVLDYKNELVNIILPVWTTAQTITIHNDIYPIIRRELKCYKRLTNDEIINMSTCVLYGTDDRIKPEHLGTVLLNNFIKRGGNGKNKQSKFMHVTEIPKDIKINIRPSSGFSLF